MMLKSSPAQANKNTWCETKDGKANSDPLNCITFGQIR